MNAAEPFRRRRVLVTGATGMIGAQLTKALIEGGADAVALVRDYVPHNDLIGCDPRAGQRTNSTALRPTVVAGELENYRLVERVIAEYEIEVVFHLAAQTLVQIATRSPIGTFKSNIEGTWNVLEACRQNSTVRAVIVASSDKAYGGSDQLPYTEETPLRAEHPYDVSKTCADLIARTYWATYELPVAVTRCGNVFGPGDLNFSRIIPGTIRSVLLDERPVIRSDGTLVRDYFYVADAVLAYLLTGAKLLESPEAIAGEAFNFSTEAPRSVLDVTRVILEVMDRTDLEPVVQNTAKAEIAAQWLSAEKARRVLGWSNRYTLEEGIHHTVPFVRSVVLGREGDAIRVAG